MLPWGPEKAIRLAQFFVRQTHESNLTLVKLQGISVSEVDREKLFSTQPNTLFPPSS